MPEPIIGKHVYGDLYGCPKEILSDKDYLLKVIKEAAEYGKATLLEIKVWEVEGEHGGISILALVIESHIALHTWPKNDYATLDVYTCGKEADPWKIFDYIVKSLKPKHYVVHYSDRSQLPIE